MQKSTIQNGSLPPISPNNQELNLFWSRGQAAIITGGSEALGLAMAAGLASAGSNIYAGE